MVRVAGLQTGSPTAPARWGANGPPYILILRLKPEATGVYGNANT